MNWEVCGLKDKKLRSKIFPVIILLRKCDRVKRNYLKTEVTCENTLLIFFSPSIEPKFWGQNFYKVGRNVILEPEPKDKLVILCIHAESRTFTCIFCKFSKDNFIKINCYFYLTISCFFLKNIYIIWLRHVYFTLWKYILY